METREFKILFGSVAKEHGFTPAYGGWYLETPTGLFVLNLQKSNFGNYFELNLKLFLGLQLSSNGVELKKTVKSFSGDIFRRQPEEFREIFDLDAEISLADRRKLLEKLFAELIDRMASGFASQAEILRLRDEGVIFLLPTIEARVNKLTS